MQDRIIALLSGEDIMYLETEGTTTPGDEAKVHVFTPMRRIEVRAVFNSSEDTRATVWARSRRDL